MLLTHGSPPWNKREQQSRGSTCQDIFSLPLQRYQPSNERLRSCLFDLKKRGEGKQIARAYGGEYKLLKLEDDTTRTKKYEELLVIEKLQADCDLKATNIILQGLPPDVYAIVNHHKYYWRFSQLINNINVINMSMRPVQVNTTFLNSLPPEWSKFLMDVKLARDLHINCLVVLVFTQGDDLIVCLNKAMAFLTVVASSRVTVQQVQRVQGQRYAHTGYKGNATSSGGNNTGEQARVVKYYNFQGEGHMARQCTQPKQPRSAAWFKEKAMLAEAQESGQILDEDQLAFLQIKAFQTAVLLANLSNYGSDVILEASHSEPYYNDMDNQSVHAI
ncbi:hypothetical protein Tco_0582985 [Tanacetum coccineum]